jgi:hypothetical protein
VGEYVQRHFGSYLRKEFHQEVSCAHPHF